MEIKVVTYEESRLAYFEGVRERQEKRIRRFENSKKAKAMPCEERYRLLSELGEILSYYDDVIAMLKNQQKSLYKSG